jgi:translation initiation factor 2 subunit 3
MSSENLNVPVINIGLVGHVDHGKTTLTHRLSGRWTDTHSEELKRGITIKLGYANTTFYKCDECNRYCSSETCSICNSPSKKIMTVSFVDAPGHESLMATMLSGASIMDGAVLMIAANEICPQPQTKEHLAALEISGINNIVVVQNKIDLVTKEEAIENYKQIKEFLKDTKFKDAPIIPISAQKEVNLDVLIEAIVETIPIPKRDDDSNPEMFIARSFDINKPGTSALELKGGILGGALKKGQLHVDDEIEIRPGIKKIVKNQVIYNSVFTKIKAIYSDKDEISKGTPGGSIALMTTLDPAIVKSDSFSGSVVGLVDKLPSVWYDIALEVNLLKRVVGDNEDLEVDNIKQNEMLMLNVNSSSTVGVVSKILSTNQIKCFLKIPICAQIGSRITISRRIGSRFRLIGYGILKKEE